MSRRICGLLAGVALAAGLAGCSKSPPPVTEVRGQVLLDGKPLPHAQVVFQPQLKDFGAEQNSTAVTDEEGRFTLKTMADKPGAVVGTHKVLVTEYTPENLRGMSADAQKSAAQYQAKLKNRPIPDDYGNLVQTPLQVEVKKDQQ